MQDNDTDKALQIPHINAYFRQATAVISASGAIDVRSGFLGFQSTKDDIHARAKTRVVADHPKLGPLPYLFPLYNPSGDDQRPIICKVDLDPPFYNYSTEPINRRGWTLQEASLARRLLIFPAVGGIVMRCSRGERSAGHLIGNPSYKKAGSLYHEFEILELHNLRDDEVTASGELKESSSEEDHTKDCDETDDDANREEKSRRGTESGQAHLWNESQGSDEGVDDGSDEDEFVGCAGSRDGFHFKDDGDANENQPLQVEDEDEDEDEAETGNEENVKQDEVCQSWYAVVRDYSQRVLSQPDDILIALGALAQEFHIQHEKFLGNYAAGLWTQRLKEGLLWHLSYLRHPDRESFIPPQKGATEYDAPSWAWASSEQPVTFRIRREPNVDVRGHMPEEPRWYIKILDCVVTARDDGNPFGAVQAATLDVKGFLAPIRRVPGSRRLNLDPCLVDDIALQECGVNNDSSNTIIFVIMAARIFELVDGHPRSKMKEVNKARLV